MSKRNNANRLSTRAMKNRLGKLSQAELDAVVIQYLTNLLRMPLHKRIQFAIKLVFKSKILKQPKEG